MRNELAEGKDAAPVQVLVDVLEEVKYMQRMSLENTVSKPLTDVADAAHAESMKAVKFGQQVDAYLADTSSTQHTKSIRLQLEQWIANHSRFEEVATGNPRLESVIKTSEELKLLAEMSLRTLDLKGQKKVISVAEKKVILGQINLIETTRSGTLLAVEPHLKKLIQAMPEK
jgi:hypothetical protein